MITNNRLSSFCIFRNCSSRLERRTRRLQGADRQISRTQTDRSQRNVLWSPGRVDDDVGSTFVDSPQSARVYCLRTFRSVGHILVGSSPTARRQRKPRSQSRPDAVRLFSGHTQTIWPVWQVGRSTRSRTVSSSLVTSHPATAARNSRTALR